VLQTSRGLSGPNTRGAVPRPRRGRGIAWQLYGLLAGGSPRTSPRAAVLWAGLLPSHEIDAMGKHCAESFPGAAC